MSLALIPAVLGGRAGARTVRRGRCAVSDRGDHRGGKGMWRSFPGTPLRLYVEALGAAYQPVLDGIAGFGIVGRFRYCRPASPRNGCRGGDGHGRRPRTSPRPPQRRHPEIRTRQTCAACSHRPFQPVERTGVRRDVAFNLAAGRSFRQACFSAGRTWLGRHAGACREGRSGGWQIGGIANRGYPAGWTDPADVGGLSNIGAARTRGPVADRADQTLPGAGGMRLLQIGRLRHLSSLSCGWFVARRDAAR